MPMSSLDVDIEIGLLRRDKWHQHQELCGQHLQGKTVLRREECSGNSILLGAFGKDRIYRGGGLASLCLKYPRHDSFSRPRRRLECSTNQRGNGASPVPRFQDRTCLLLFVVFLFVTLRFASFSSVFSLGSHTCFTPHQLWFLRTSSKTLGACNLEAGSSIPNFLSVCCKYWNIAGFWNVWRISTLSFGFQKSASF